MQPFIISFAIAAPYSLEKSVCGELTDISQRMKAREMYSLFPYIKV